MKEEHHQGWRWGSIFSILLYVCLFLYLIYPYSDFDWGWHYRYGEYFFTHWQPLRNDIFSWTMTDYAWINTSWFYDLIVYALSRSTGFFGLSATGALISTLTFYVAVKTAKSSLWQTGVLAILYVFLVKGVVWEGLRSQMIGFLFLSILVHLLSKSDSSRKPIFCIPFLFFFWANTHGSFLLGLFILGIAVLMKFLIHELEAQRARLAIILVFSVFATLINPFSYRIYIEIFHHFNNPLLKNIVEWMPVKFSLTNVEYDVLLGYFVLLGIGFWRRNNVRDANFFMIAALFGFYALTARRNWAVFAVATLPFAALSLKTISRNIRSDWLQWTTWISYIGVVVLVTAAVVVRLPKFHIWSHTFEDYCMFSSGCSEGLTQFLLKSPPKGRGLNKYSWGSYLIGRGVQMQTFIDGRMAIWIRDGFTPVTEYKRIYLLGDTKKFNDSHFDWLIVGSDFLLLDRVKSSTDLGEWTVVYSDDKAQYFVRK